MICIDVPNDWRQGRGLALSSRVVQGGAPLPVSGFDACTKSQELFYHLAGAAHCQMKHPSALAVPGVRPCTCTAHALLNIRQSGLAVLGNGIVIQAVGRGVSMGCPSSDLADLSTLLRRRFAPSGMEPVSQQVLPCPVKAC